jgi:hypothetical protein
LHPPQKYKYAKVFRKILDVFAWGYEDIKIYDASIIQHRIPLKEREKPIRQKLR